MDSRHHFRICHNRGGLLYKILIDLVIFFPGVRRSGETPFLSEGSLDQVNSLTTSSYLCPLHILSILSCILQWITKTHVQRTATSNIAEPILLFQPIVKVALLIINYHQFLGSWETYCSWDIHQNCAANLWNKESDTHGVPSLPLLSSWALISRSSSRTCVPRLDVVLYLVSFQWFLVLSIPSYYKPSRIKFSTSFQFLKCQCYLRQFSTVVPHGGVWLPNEPGVCILILVVINKSPRSFFVWNNTGDVFLRGRHWKCWSRVTRSQNRSIIVSDFESGSIKPIQKKLKLRGLIFDSVAEQMQLQIGGCRNDLKWLADELCMRTSLHLISSPHYLSIFLKHHALHTLPRDKL
jgi:hypothetical protein